MCVAPLAHCVALFPEDFCRHSLCQNWVQDISLERSLRLISKPTGIFQFGVHFPVKIKSPKSGQNVPNEAASRQSAVAVNF